MQICLCVIRSSVRMQLEPEVEQAISTSADKSPQRAHRPRQKSKSEQQTARNHNRQTTLLAVCAKSRLFLRFITCRWGEIAFSGCDHLFWSSIASILMSLRLFCGDNRLSDESTKPESANNFHWILTTLTIRSGAEIGRKGLERELMSRNDRSSWHGMGNNPKVVHCRRVCCCWCRRRWKEFQKLMLITSKTTKRPFFQLIKPAIVLHVSQSKSIYSQTRKLSFIAMNSAQEEESDKKWHVKFS